MDGQAAVDIMVLRGLPWAPPGGWSKCLGVSCWRGQGCPQGPALIALASSGVDECPPQRCAARAVGTHFLTPGASDAGPSGSSPLSLLVTSCPVQLPRGATRPVLFAAVGFQCFSPLPVALEGAQVPAMSLLLDAMSIRPFQGSRWAWARVDIMNQHVQGPASPWD